MTGEREALVAALSGPGAEAARDALLARPDWLVGAPPEPLVEALIDGFFAGREAALDVAHAWARGPMASALLARLERRADPDETEACAWLLAQLPAPDVLPDLVRATTDPTLPVVARTWLAAALDRLAFADLATWPDVADAVDHLTRAPAPALRAAAAGICGSLPRTPEARATLVRLLDDPDDAVIESSLQMLLLHGAPLDTPRVRALEAHPRPTIRDRAARLRAAPPTDPDP